MYPSPRTSLRRTNCRLYPTVQCAPSLRKMPFCREPKAFPTAPVPGEMYRAPGVLRAIWVPRSCLGEIVIIGNCLDLQVATTREHAALLESTCIHFFTPEANARVPCGAVFTP